MQTGNLQQLTPHSRCPHLAAFLPTAPPPKPPLIMWRSHRPTVLPPTAHTPILKIIYSAFSKFISTNTTSPPTRLYFYGGTLKKFLSIFIFLGISARMDIWAEHILSTLLMMELTVSKRRYGDRLRSARRNTPAENGRGDMHFSTISNGQAILSQPHHAFVQHYFLQLASAPWWKSNLSLLNYCWMSSPFYATSFLSISTVRYASMHVN